jgi:hypothetical protein
LPSDQGDDVLFALPFGVWLQRTQAWKAERIRRLVFGWLVSSALVQRPPGRKTFGTSRSGAIGSGWR